MPRCTAAEACRCPTEPIAGGGQVLRCDICGDIAHEGCIQQCRDAEAPNEPAATRCVCAGCYPNYRAYHEEEEEVIQQLNRIRVNQDRFLNQPFWHNANGQNEFESHEVVGAREELLQQQYGRDFHGMRHSSASGIEFSSMSEQRSGDSWTRILRCYFWTEKRGGCSWCCRQVRTGNRYKFQLPNPSMAQHQNHNAETTAYTVRTMISSPSVLIDKQPQHFLVALAKAHPNLTAQQHREMKNYYGETRRKYLRQHLGSGKANTFAGMRLTLDAFVRQTVLNRMHSENKLEAFPDEMWLCEDSQGRNSILHGASDEEAAPSTKKKGKTKINDPRLVAVFTTDELILNAYRQYYHGGKCDIHFQIDASYRYVTQSRMGYIPIKVHSHCQVGHTVAYAVMNYEDEAAQEFILDAVKTAVELVVNDRIARGDKYC